MCARERSCDASVVHNTSIPKEGKTKDAGTRSSRAGLAKVSIDIQRHGLGANSLRVPVPVRGVRSLCTKGKRNLRSDVNAIDTVY